MKRYDCYYTNDFGNDYPAFSKEKDDGDWISFEDAQAEVADMAQTIKLLRDGLTAAYLQRDALRTGIKTLQSTCCGSHDPCNGCRALLKLLELPS